MGAGPAIGDRNHRVTICSSTDVVITPGELVKIRDGIVTGWAAISPSKASRFSKDGVAIDDDHMRKSHDIIMNYNPDLMITLAAWVYEARLKSPPRWFKIIRVMNMDEASRYWKFECRLVESTDDIVKPVREPDHSGLSAVPMPNGINL